MIIREACESDLEGILNVLKASLGETSSKKTEEVWCYKHILNPFGKSLVLVAILDGKVVGVRAFMRWRWQIGKKVYSSFRAVDTATHPDFQGKGIFKKLTLEALNLGVQEGSDFIFNTPNSQSRPGYLKMGWKVVGKVPVFVSPFFNMNFRRSKNIPGGSKVSSKTLNRYKAKKIDSKRLFTPKDADFLSWRYRICPLQDYLIFENEDIFIAAYIKKHKHFKELRISEIIADIANKTIRKKILIWANEFNVNIITSGSKIFHFGIKGGFGPILTLKDLKIDFSEKSSLLDIDIWNNSIGDLELF